jgi:hypothetical protein
MKVRESLADWAAHNLICGWKKSWKFVSMQGMVLAVATQATWVTLPDDWRASIPGSVVAGITIACLIIGIVGRIYAQKGVDDGNETKE